MSRGNQHGTAPADTKSIAQLSSKYGVTLRTLRFYEQRGLLTPIRDGLSRHYTLQDEIKLQLIMKGKRFGFSLAEISDLIETHLAARHPISARAPETVALSLKSEQVTEQIDWLERERARIDGALCELYEIQLSHNVS